MELKVLPYFILMLLSLSLVFASQQVINDSKAYISSDYLSERPGDINSVFMTKLFTGNVSFGFLFNGGMTTPSNARLIRDEDYYVEHSLTCYNESGFELNPNYAWCIANNTLRWNNSFDRADSLTNTIYWDTLHSREVEIPINDKFDKKAVDILGYDTAYIVKNVPMNEGVPKNVRFYLSFPFGMSAKYDIIAVPSFRDDDLLNAYNDGFLYILDPLINTTRYQVGDSNDWSSDALNASTNISYNDGDFDFELGYAGGASAYASTITAHYSWNDSVGEDDTGNGYTAVGVGGIALDGADYKLGGDSLDTTPAGDYLKLPQSITVGGSTAYSFSLWVHGDLGTDKFILAQDGNGTESFMLYSAADNTITFRHKDGGGSNDISSTSSLASDNWHFICGGYNGTHIFLVINDTQEASSPETNPANAHLSGVWVGDRQVPGAGITNIVDELSFWINTSITAASCIDIYNSGAGRYLEYYSLGDFDPGKNTYTSKIFNLSEPIVSLLPTINYTKNGFEVNVSFTCDANETATFSGLISNGVGNSCPVSGDAIQYKILLGGNSSDSPEVNNLTINLVFNSVPEVTTPELYPASPSTSDNIIANTTYTDVDGDAGNVTFVWEVNGTNPFNETVDVVNGSLVNSTLLSVYLSSGVLVNVTVYAYDNNSFISSNKTSSTVNISGTPPPGAQNMTVTARNKISINFSWVNPSSSLWNYTQVWFDAVNVINTSGNTYNASGLTPNTTYLIQVYTVGDGGEVNSTALSLNASTQYNIGPDVQRVYPVNASATIEENVTTSFQINATDDDGNVFVRWFVDGVAKLLEEIASGASSVYNWVTGYTDEGEHNITAIVNDTFNYTGNMTWNVTVLDTFPIPSKPLGILPNGGDYEYVVPVLCEIDFRLTGSGRYQFRYSINDSNFTSINRNDTDGFLEWDISEDDIGTNYSFQCRVTDLGGVGNWSDATPNITKTNINHFYLFTPKGQNDFASLHPYDLGVVAEVENSIKAYLAAILADCNGDGVFDYAFDYRDENITKSRETFTCFNVKGVIEHTIGMVLYKNNTASWDVLGCRGLDETENYCVVYKSYDIQIS